MRAVGTYVMHMFVRLHLNVWTTDGRLHPCEWMGACRFGCAEARDDLRHYVKCSNMWIPTYRALIVEPAPSWAAHAALEGNLIRRVAAVKGWLVAHDALAGVADAVVAGVDYERMRVSRTALQRRVEVVIQMRK